MTAVYSTMSSAFDDTFDPSRLTHGWVNSPNTRGTFEVLWTCFVTIFVCTFTVLHLNVPAADDHHWQILLRKVKWMTYSIVIPELVTACAFAQYVSARKSVKAMKLLETGQEWTMRHAFYWNMGGAWIFPRDEQSPFPINAAQYRELLAAKVICRPHLTSREIWDKSKADKFVKLLACVQIGWLSVEYIARATQRLPISVLEVATVGFAMRSIATFALRFHKPNDIATPTIIPIDLTLTELLEKLKCPRDFVWQDTPLDSVDFTNAVNSPSFVSHIILKAPRWPGRGRYVGSAKRIRNDVFGLKYSKLDQIFVGSIWLGYSAIHIAAWNFEFPSQTERTLWRVCSLIMSGSMVVVWIFGNRKFFLLVGYIMPSKRKQMEKISNERRQVAPIQIALGGLAGIAYLVARMCLIVQALMSLRALPAGVFETVRWSEFLPYV